MTRNSDARFSAFIAGKRVAVVGNAQSLLDAAHGAQIDGFDVIVRLNKGFVKDPHAQGSRTEAVGLTPELDEDEMITMFQPELLLFLIPKLRHYKIFKPENVARTVFYKYRYWLADRNLIGRRPSSGFMAISFLLRMDAAKEIALFGFDFGKTATYYNPDGYKTPHNYPAEAAIVRDWAQQGRLTINPG